MAPVKIRAALHEYIDTVDEEKLEAIYIVLKDNIAGNYEYSADELSEIYSRRNKYKTNEADLLTTEEFVNFVRQNKL